MTETSAVTNLNCPYCGMMHPNLVCPSVKAFEYYPDGTVKRVEFHGPQPARVDYDIPGPRVPFKGGIAY